MKVAIISDIHGNYEALKAVYEDIKSSNIDGIFCLGDLIGYGPESERVVEFIIDKGIPCILGNHELALFDDAEVNNFNENAYGIYLVSTADDNIVNGNVVTTSGGGAPNGIYVHATSLRNLIDSNRINVLHTGIRIGSASRRYLDILINKL